MSSPTSPGRIKISALAYADAILAGRALAPFVAGRRAKAPQRPASLSEAFDWDRWKGIVGNLAAPRPVSDDNQVIAAMLLQRADSQVEALEALRLASDWKNARAAAHQMIRRLDRRCADVLNHPLAYRDPLYRFNED